jgi:hypothetical protein
VTYTIEIPRHWERALENAAKSERRSVELFIRDCVGEILAEIEAYEHGGSSDE